LFFRFQLLQALRPDVEHGAALVLLYGVEGALRPMSGLGLAPCYGAGQKPEVVRNAAA
jgi:hypothetical protein